MNINTINVLLLITILILIIFGYSRESIKYSNLSLFVNKDDNKEKNIFSYNKIYFVTTIILVLLVNYILYEALLEKVDYFSDFIEDKRSLIIPLLVILSLYCIVILNPDVIIDETKFYKKPKKLNKNIKLIYFLIILLSLSADFLKNKLLLVIPFIYIIKLLLNMYYSSCKYNLPKTFN